MFGIMKLKIVFILTFVYNFSEFVKAYTLNSSQVNQKMETSDEGFKFLVTGGYRPTEHSYAKHAVSLRTPYTGSVFGDNHFCGGAIIAPTLVLTAAHCVVNPGTRVKKSPKKIIVVAGSPKRMEKTSKTQILEVEQIIRHANYKPSDLRNDIALLRLKEEIIEDHVTAERIPIASSQAVPGTKCTVVGWGRIFHLGPLPDEALYVDLEIYTSLKCKSITELFADGMVCAADRNDFEKDSCSGDSGGPFICNNEVAGIVSFGEGCALPGGAGFYTDVYYYKDWLAENDASHRHCNWILYITIAVITKLI